MILLDDDFCGTSPPASWLMEHRPPVVLFAGLDQAENVSQIHEYNPSFNPVTITSTTKQPKDDTQNPSPYCPTQLPRLCVGSRLLQR